MSKVFKIKGYDDGSAQHVKVYDDHIEVKPAIECCECYDLITDIERKYIDIEYPLCTRCGYRNFK